MKSHLHKKNKKGNRKNENVKIRAFCETAKQHPNCTYTYILVLAISQIFQKTKNKKHKNLFFLYYHFFRINQFLNGQCGGISFFSIVRAVD